MNFNDVLSEISTPTGHIFLRFGAKDTGQKDEYGNPKQYLVGWAGFGNSPDQVHYGNARVKFNKLTSAEDVVKAVKEVLGDTQFGKVFISAKTLIIVPPKKIPDDAGFLGKFFDWVRREGGDRISLYQKDDPTSDPPEKPDEKVTVKRKKKPNPMFGKKIRDIGQAAPQKTVTFTVGPRFYKQAQRDLPNLMKYRGPGGTFVMPNELFMQFRAQAEKTYPYAEIKIQNRVTTAEDSDDMSKEKGSPYDRGVADGYYGRPATPHKYAQTPGGTAIRVKLTDPKEIEQYMAGYKDDSYGSKEYESMFERSTSEKQARTMAAAAHNPKFAKKVGIKTSVAKEFNKADKGTKQLSNAMKKEAVNPAQQAAIAIAKKKKNKKTDEGILDTLGTLGGAGLGYYMGGGGADNLLGVLPVAGALGGGYLGHHTGKILGHTFDEDAGTSPMGHASAGDMLNHVEQVLESMQMSLERDIEWHLTDFLGGQTVTQLIAPINQGIENLKKFIEQAQAHSQTASVGEDGADPMVKNLPPINATGDGNQARTNSLAAMAGSQPAKAPAPTAADKQAATNLEGQMAPPSGPQWDTNGGKHMYENSFLDMEDDDYWLMEAGKASRAFCKANARKRGNMGASQLSSCISQGYLPHKSGKSVKVADRRVKLDGIKMKGEKYGGPRSTKAGE